MNLISTLSPELWSRLSDVVLAAQTLDGEQRRLLLAEATAQDPQLRSHLDTFLRAADQLRESETLYAPKLDLDSLPLDPSKADLEGAELGNYRLGRCLGRGGMGEVYLADRIDGELDRQVAVKVLRVGLGPRAEALFAEERKILAALEHPSIARLYDAGHSVEGLPFLVMEYVQGLPIDEFCCQRDLNVPDRLELFVRVCRAVHFAHRKSVLHSDLKPANILVQPSGEPMLLDFGIARWLSRESTHQEHVQAFTPAFASPEQVNPKLLAGQALGVASDLYALGQILRLLVTHSPRFAAGAPMPADLAAILGRATHERADQRYSSAEQLAEELERFCSGHPVLAREPTLGYVSRRFVGRHRGGVTLMALMVLWVVGSLIMLAAQKTRIAQQRDQAQSLAAEAQQERQAVLRLADIRRLRDLEAEAETLWPVHPSRANAMAAWLISAQELVSRKASHSAALETITNRLEEITISRSGSSQDQPDELAWQQEILHNLVESLTSWQDAEKGLMAEVSSRFEKAKSLRQRSIEKFQDRWQRTLGDLADAERFPHYRNLDLTPQVGLVPLGPDPDSGLFEFAALDTGTLPQRNDKSQELILGEDFAVILVLIPAGDFIMGSQQDDPEGSNYDPNALMGRDFPQPPQGVDVEAFLLSKFELTQAQWAALTGDEWPSRHNPRTASYDAQEPTSGRHPVEQVSWQDADQWLRRFSLQLPKEDQWEYAARAGSDTPFWTGADINSLSGAANVADRHLRDNGGNPEWSYSPSLDDGYGLHAPVGSYRANAFGLHDVHGNVWEWCDGSPEVQSNYSSLPDKRTARGGSWWYTGPFAKVTYRIYGTETSAIGDLGMRPARRLTRENPQHKN